MASDGCLGAMSGSPHVFPAAPIRALPFKLLFFPAWRAVAPDGIRLSFATAAPRSTRDDG